MIVMENQISYYRPLVTKCGTNKNKKPTNRLITYLQGESFFVTFKHIYTFI